MPAGSPVAGVVTFAAGVADAPASSFSSGMPPIGRPLDGTIVA